MAQRKPLLIPAVLAAAVLMLGASRAFVSAPPRAVAPATALAVSLLAPLAAHADLPPLEDLAMDEIDPTREFGPKEATFMGISFPVMLGGIAFAISWAFLVVSNLKPAKEEDGSYVTYTGAGELPPEGYTNPLDPRLSEEYADEDDLAALKASQSKLPKKKSAGSAVV
mmetsp:Transcript_63656/g.163875  ORF Transcript_63656/g.163875 Transcript_63656/m.163875 type:complete len:168 (+) Transcript_63656:67-570(+)